VAALWYHGSKQGGAAVEQASAGNLKPVWSFAGKRVDWLSDREAQGPDYLRHATQVKNIWVPYGE
jgi:aldehyde dehydrogenase (NAD+)